MNSIDNLINNLNKEQKEAVLSRGSELNCCRSRLRKTRVLTTRLIHIINQKAFLIKFCVTFTNKAAKEMQNRVLQHVGRETQMLFPG